MRLMDYKKKRRFFTSHLFSLLFHQQRRLPSALGSSVISRRFSSDCLAIINVFRLRRPTSGCSPKSTIIRLKPATTALPSHSLKRSSASSTKRSPTSDLSLPSSRKSATKLRGPRAKRKRRRYRSATNAMS